MQKKPKKRWTLLAVALAVVLAVSAYQLIRSGIDYRQGDEDYSAAEDLAGIPDLSTLPPVTPAALSEPPAVLSSAAPAPEESQQPAPVYVDPYADALRNMDFATLREVNEDVLGWILVPGTRISYPIVQAEDNSYYLNHTWRGNRSAVGAIFLECRNSADLTDFNTIIYGHRMGNGTMFNALKSYSKQNFWAEHPCIYLTDDNGSRRFEIFAAYEVSTAGDTYRLLFRDQEEKQSFLDYCMAQSVIDTGIVPTAYDQVVTLSTCTGRGHATRWVVQGVLRGEVPVEDLVDQPQETPALPEESQPLPAESQPLPAEESLPTPEELPQLPPEAEPAEPGADPAESRN